MHFPLYPATRRQIPLEIHGGSTAFLTEPQKELIVNNIDC